MDDWRTGIRFLSGAVIFNFFDIEIISGVHSSSSPISTGGHMVRHLRCVFINYNWINQLSNTTIWWLDICCLLHRYQLHFNFVFPCIIV